MPAEIGVNFSMDGKPIRSNVEVFWKCKLSAIKICPNWLQFKEY